MIRVIGNNFNLVQTYQGLTRCMMNQTVNAAVPAGLLLDPRTHALVMNGLPGHLQFYSLHNDTQLYNVSSQDTYSSTLYTMTHNSIMSVVRTPTVLLSTQ